MSQVAPGVYRLTRGGEGNVYLLIDGEEMALIDAGLPGTWRRVGASVQGLGRRLEEVRHILLTHAHLDHAGGVPALLRRTNAQVLAHPDDAHPSRSGAALGYMRMLGALDMSLPFLRRAPVHAFAADGDALPLLGGLQVLHTPGHTPGSLTFYLPRHGVLFCGDLLLVAEGDVSTNRAYPGSNLSDYMASLGRLAALEFDVLCPGHGPPLIRDASQKLRSLAQAAPGHRLSWRLFGGR